MIKIMKRSINLNLGRIVYPITVSSVEQLRIECNEAERNFPRRDVRNPLPNSKIPRQINEVYFEEVDENDVNRSNVIEINALKVTPQQQQKQQYQSQQQQYQSQQQQYQQQQNKPTVICWNCKVAGHVFMECPIEQRSLFCYKCGKPDVTTPNCPICQQKNLQSGVGASGDPRLRENPVTKDI